MTDTEARRVRVASLYLEGKSQYEIGRELKVAHSTVSRDLEAIRAVWLESALCDFNARKAEEMARIAWIEREAIDAWQRSKLPADTVTVRTDPNAPDPDADPAANPPPPAVKKVLEKTRKREYRDGSAEYLRVVQWCVEQRRAIFGFDAARQLQMVGAVTVKVTVEPPRGVTADDVRYLADLADRCDLLGPAPAPEPGGHSPDAAAVGSGDVE